MLTYKEIRLKVEMPVSIMKHCTIPSFINLKTEMPTTVQLNVDYAVSIFLTMNAVGFDGVTNE